MLLDPDLDARPWIDSALDVIRRQAGCDVMILPYVKTSTALREALALLSQNAIVEHEAGVCVNLRHETDWQSYYNSLSPTLRKKNRAFRRKIEKVGEIKLAVVPAGDPRCPDLIDWMLAQKRIWSERMGKSGPWLSSPHYREFLVRLLSDPNAIPKPFLFTLTAGDILLGVKLQSAGKSLCEALVAAFNADYEKISPGVVLDEFCVQWAFEQKLDCDFGNGLERNKLFWSRHESVETATFTVPLSLWGRSYLAARNWARKRRAKPPAQNNAEATEENDTTAGG
jgi:CelD/BcsL family acetyltransferase involved in cellulose biosynthesis